MIHMSSTQVSVAYEHTGERVETFPQQGTLDDDQIYDQSSSLPVSLPADLEKFLSDLEERWNELFGVHGDGDHDIDLEGLVLDSPGQPTTDSEQQNDNNELPANTRIYSQSSLDRFLQTYVFASRVAPTINQASGNIGNDIGNTDTLSFTPQPSEPRVAMHSPVDHVEYRNPRSRPSIKYKVKRFRDGLQAEIDAANLQPMINRVVESKALSGHRGGTKGLVPEDYDPPSYVEILASMLLEAPELRNADDKRIKFELHKFATRRVNNPLGRWRRKQRRGGAKPMAQAALIPTSNDGRPANGAVERSPTSNSLDELERLQL